MTNGRTKEVKKVRKKRRHEGRERDGEGERCRESKGGKEGGLGGGKQEEALTVIVPRRNSVCSAWK